METKILFDYFVANQERIVKLIGELVAIESPSRDIEGSRAVCNFLEAEARKISSVSGVERIVSRDHGEHILIRAFQKSVAKQVLILGHTDTVHPRGTVQKNPLRIEGGKMFGCGIFDMKANCVLMLEILRAFDELKLVPKRPVSILLTCDEEIGSQTGREFVEREARKSEKCFVLEPSAQGRAKTGRKGTATYSLRAHGIPSHAGLEPEKGASAILEIAHQIEEISALNSASKGTSVNVCTIQGGTATNVIPQFAECSIDVRFATLAEAHKIEQALRELKPRDGRVRLELLGGINRAPLERTDAVISLYERAREIALRLDYVLGETQVGGASDGNFVGAIGVPVLDGIGIRGDGAHTLSEHILLEDIPFRGALLTALIAEGENSK